MPQNVIQYDLLISCPSDIRNELTSIDETVQEFNEMYSDTLGISIRTKHWRKSSYAQSGGKPQALLNDQFVKNCDAAVALLWTRFGTPTDEYGSGTEEEIEIMLGSGKQVFMYFSDKPLPPSQQNVEEYIRVQAFKEKYKDKGIYFAYSSDDEFKKLFFAHLSKHFLTEKRITEIKTENQPNLIMTGIDAKGRLSEKLSVQHFVPQIKFTKSQYLDRIHTLYSDIKKMNVGKLMQMNNKFLLSINQPVEIDDGERELLVEVSKSLSIELTESFFDLGNLSINSFSGATLYGGTNLEGSTEEKKKYKLIKQLHEAITDFVNYVSFEEAFSNLKCIKLALTNAGKAIDEDVEITLMISKDALLLIEDFPELGVDTMRYLLNDYDIDEIFEIPSTSELNDYASSKAPRPHVSRAASNIGLLGYNRNYREDFFDTLKDTFCYSVYTDDDNYIVKLKVDYIKHNTSVAFPSVIFLKSDIPYLEYRISSKNSPEIVGGRLDNDMY
ncbi:MAG: hypothetical protein GX947_01255 [Tissierellia bacterium]|nr:hypothetical protein [Tissierellia bacterium]